MQATIVIQAQFETRPGYASYVRVQGSKYACASFWAVSPEAARKAAQGYCARYNLTIR